MAFESPDTASVQRVITVHCAIATAFRVWTEQIDIWWPKNHSRSGDPNTVVVLEGRVGGRLYERDSAGREYHWGEIVAWEPPQRLVYHWYLGSSPEQPSLVVITFHAEAPTRTRVEVVHRGPELIGERWPIASPIFHAAYGHLLPAFAAACAGQL